MPSQGEVRTAAAVEPVTVAREVPVVNDDEPAFDAADDFDELDAPQDIPLTNEDDIIEQQAKKVLRFEKELESTLDGQYWALPAQTCRRRRYQTVLFSP